MNENDLIYTTTGFIIPNNTHYTKVETEDDIFKTVIQRTSTDMMNKRLSFFKNNNVYTSDVAKNELATYEDEKSSRAYYSLVMFAHTILFPMSTPIEFLKTQVDNKYLSNMGFNFCLNLVRSLYVKDLPLSGFTVVPPNIRFNFNILDKADIDKRFMLLKHELSRFSKDMTTPQLSPLSNMDEFISTLAVNKNSFISFYKYVFTDN